MATERERAAGPAVAVADVMAIAKRLSIVLFAASAPACVATDGDEVGTGVQEIIGGQTVQVGAYPTVVGLSLGGDSPWLFLMPHL